MFLICKTFCFLQNSLCFLIRKGYATGSSFAVLAIYPAAYKKTSKKLSAIKITTL